MANTTKVAIAGVTGKFARVLASALLAKPNVEIHGICRDPSKVPEEISSNPRVKIFQAEAAKSTKLRAALQGTSVCVCCYLGDDSLMLDGQKTLINACVAEGVARYVASDYSFDFRGLKRGDLPAKDFQLKTKAYLDEKEKLGKIKGVHVLNGAFMEVLLSPFIGIYDRDSNNFRFWGTGDEPWDMTTYADTARFVAEVVCDPTATGYLHFLGDRKSIREMADVFGDTYGQRPALQRLGSMEGLREKMLAARDAEPSNVFAWLGMHFNYFIGNGSTSLGKIENGRYSDVTPIDLADFFAEHKQEGLMMF